MARVCGSLPGQKAAELGMHSVTASFETLQFYQILARSTYLLYVLYYKYGTLNCSAFKIFACMVHLIEIF